MVMSSPLMAMLVSGLAAMLPGLAAVLSNLFWGLLGEVEIFSLASGLLEQYMYYEQVSMGDVALATVYLALKEMLEAFVLGCGVFAVKSCFVHFNRQFIHNLTRPKWLISVLGVALGVALATLTDLTSGAMRAMLQAVFTVGLIIFGIFKILNARPMTASRRRYASRRNSIVIYMLLEIVSNVFSALCAVILITCVLEGPRFVADGGSVEPWLLLAFFSIVLLWIIDAVASIFENPR